MSEKKPTIRREIKVAVAYPPHVTLLPPEVGQRKAANRAKGRAIFLAIVALGVAILATAGANLIALQRVLALESARADTLTLVEEQSEYSEVRAANQRLQSITSARIFAASTEISVKTVIDGLASKLAGGMAITAYEFETATPLLGYGDPVSPLDPDRMAQFRVEVKGNSIAEIDAWVRKLPSVVGVIDAAVVSVEEDEGVYVASVAVFVSPDALLHRFDGFEPEAAEEAPAPTPAPTPNPPQSPSPTDTPAPADDTTD